MPSQSGLQSPPGIEVPIEIDAGLVGEHFVDVAARTRHDRRTLNQIYLWICTIRVKDAEAPARPLLVRAAVVGRSITVPTRNPTLADELPSVNTNSGLILGRS
jgi:hypothetical protein